MLVLIKRIFCFKSIYDILNKKRKGEINMKKKYVLEIQTGESIM